MTRVQVEVGSADAMETLGAKLARAVSGGLVVYLVGELGVGKTTLVRGILRGMGFAGAVKSPTFTLVECYPVAGVVVYHLDLYRLEDADELEAIGIRDYVDGENVLLIEWPERGVGGLPDADSRISISYRDARRRVAVDCRSPLGEKLCAALGSKP